MVNRGEVFRCLVFRCLVVRLLPWTPPFLRGALLAKGPDYSFGGVPVGYCPDEVHMEEEGVQVKVQAKKEEEIGEKHTEGNMVR